MSHKARVAAIATLVALGAVTMVGLKLKLRRQHAAASSPQSLGYTGLPENEQRPEGFEPFLSEHPEDEDHRAAALVWYARRDNNPEQLKNHALEMIKYHPGSMHIYFENTRLFYLEPDYRSTVIASLEDQVTRGKGDHNVYWNLAMTCEQGALPVKFEDPESRHRFLQYHELPEDAALPTKLDAQLADKALGYYRLAIKNAEPEYVQLYVKQMVELLAQLEKPRESVDFARDMIKSTPALAKDAGLLCAFGRSLKEVGESREAEKILGQVRGFDKEGFEGGPAHTTTEAEMQLGELALTGGDAKSAVAYLLASVDVQRCCHNSTQGISLRLAKQLLDAGEYRAVTAFCETALRKFVPGQPETQALLTRAQAKSAEKDQPGEAKRR